MLIRPAHFAEQLLDHRRKDRPCLVNHLGRKDPFALVVTDDHDGAAFVVAEIELAALWRLASLWRYAGEPGWTTQLTRGYQALKLTVLYYA
jgi:hypothetical protein